MPDSSDWQVGITFRLPTDHKDRLDREVEARALNRSEVLRRLVAAQLEVWAAKPQRLELPEG